jgi:WD40 repeat protein
VTSLAFTPDSKVLVSGSMDKTVRLWDVAEGREQRTLTYATGVGGFRLSPKGKVLAISASAGGQRMTIQEMSTGRELLQLRGHQKAVTDAAFSSDGRKLITGSDDETVRVWELAPAKRKDVFALTDLSPAWTGSGTAVCFSPDGENLLTVFTDRTFTIWATRTLIESKHYPVPVTKFACAGLASGGKLAAFVGVAGNVVLWNGGTGETNSFGRPTTNASTRAVFSKDGKRLAIGGESEVSVLDISRQEKPRSFSIQDGESSRPDDIVMSLAFSQNGQIVMAGFYDGLVKIWDLSGPFQLALKGGNDQVHGLALLSDMRTLVSVSREVRFWDLNSRQHLPVHREPKVRGWGCSVSPDGRRLAVGGSDGLITIFDLASRQILVALEGHESPVLDVAFLGDGDTLVSVGDDQVRVWRAASFAEADGEMLKK